MPAAFSNFFKKNDQGASKVSESKEDSSKKKDTSSKNVKEGTHEIITRGPHSQVSPEQRSADS